MVSVECPEVLPETFSSPVQSGLLNSESSYSTDTGEFIRNVTECIASSFYTPSFTKLQDPVASEDEVAFSFGSDTSSHHSLPVEGDPVSPWSYFVENKATGQKLECSPSPTPRPNEQGRSSYSSTVVRVERVDANHLSREQIVTDNTSTLNVKSAKECSEFEMNKKLKSNDRDTAEVEEDEKVMEGELVQHSHTDALGLDLFGTHEDLGLTPTPGPHPFHSDDTPTIYYQSSGEGSSLQPSSSSESLKAQEVPVLESQRDSDQDELDRLLDDPFTSEVAEVEPKRRASHSGLGGSDGDIETLLVVPSRRSSLPMVHVIPPPSLPTPSSVILTTEFYSNSRKHSDPAVNIRKEVVQTRTITRQRCLSDSEAPHLSIDEDETRSEEEVGSSVLGYDSGYHDEKSSRFQESLSCFSPRVSLQSSDLNSLDEAMIGLPSCNHRLRRPTPHPHKCNNPQAQDSDHTHSNAMPTVTGTNVQPRERFRRSLLKNCSQSSLGGMSITSIGASSESQSVSLSSILDHQSSHASAAEILSSLGFDDFDSPQLIPDRFIPQIVEHAKPSSMRSFSINQQDSYDCDHDSISGRQDTGANTRSNSFASVLSTSYLFDEEPNSTLPLGATADNFASTPVVSTPIQSDTSALMHSEVESGDSPVLYPNTANISYFNRMLETVPEETASDLSASPRWISPRVSIDHSVINIDIAEGKLGASLKPRKRSLPQREGYKVSVGSLVDSEAGESIQFSITSYDDELAAEKEREREREESSASLPVEDQQHSNRRRRRGVYTPPPSLLSWLSTQQPIHEEDSDELPWPFSEQVKLRKSLTEIQQAQEAAALNEAENNSTENAQQQHHHPCSPSSDLRHDVHYNSSAQSLPLSSSIPRSSSSRSSPRTSPRLSPRSMSPVPLQESEEIEQCSFNNSCFNSPRFSPEPLSVEEEITGMPQFSPNSNPEDQGVGRNSADSEHIEHKQELNFELRCQRLEEQLTSERAQSAHKEESLTAEIKELEGRLRATQEESSREFFAMAETCSRLQEVSDPT